MSNHEFNLPRYLSGEASILHRTRRHNFEKRVVAVDGQTCVLYRFPDSQSLDRLENILRSPLATHASLQQSLGRTTTFLERLRFGNWIALSYQAGKPLLGSKLHPDAIISLGKALAHLHTSESSHSYALFQKTKPLLPHQAFIQQSNLGAEQQQWVEESHRRLQGITRFQLTHGDLYGCNVIEDENHAVSLIDYELFTYEPAGIELAMTLMRSFCRQEANRKLLLETYLEHCLPQQREIWLNHATDFIFAAAARLGAGRQRRAAILARKNVWLGRILKLPLSQKYSQALKSTMEKNAELGEAALAREIPFRRIAHRTIESALTTPDLDPVMLITRGLKP